MPPATLRLKNCAALSHTREGKSIAASKPFCHRLFHQRSWDHEQNNTQEMAKAAGEDKDMPDGMIERNAVLQIEQGSRRIRHPARQQPHQASNRKVRPKRAYGDDNNPPHTNVDQRGNQLEPTGEKDLEYNPCEGQAPNDTEQRPAPRPA